MIMPLERQDWSLRMKPGQPIVCCAVAALVACSPGLSAAAAEPAIAKIVGLGATPCAQFEREANERSALQREYLQGRKSSVASLWAVRRASMWGLI